MPSIPRHGHHAPRARRRPAIGPPAPAVLSIPPLRITTPRTYAPPRCGQPRSSSSRRPSPGSTPPPRANLRSCPGRGAAIRTVPAALPCRERPPRPSTPTRHPPRTAADSPSEPGPSAPARRRQHPRTELVPSKPPPPTPADGAHPPQTATDSTPGWTPSAPERRRRYPKTDAIGWTTTTAASANTHSGPQWVLALPQHPPALRWHGRRAPPAGVRAVARAIL